MKGWAGENGTFAYNKITAASRSTDEELGDPLQIAVEWLTSDGAEFKLDGRTFEVTFAAVLWGGKIKVCRPEEWGGGEDQGKKGEIPNHLNEIVKHSRRRII